MSEGRTMRVRLKGVVSDIDRHGNVRHYYRAPGRAKVRLRQPPGSAAFLAEYRAAVEGMKHGDQPAPRRPAGLAATGTLRRLAVDYFAYSGQFQVLAPDSRKRRRALIERLCIEHGDKPFNALEPRHIVRIRDHFADRPGTSRNVLKALSGLYEWAREAGLVQRNPVRDVARLKLPGEGWHSWTPDEIGQYLARHPAGSRARLGLCLALFTGLRVSDLARLGRQHIREGWITLKPLKTAGSSGVVVELPVNPALTAEIERAPREQLALLVTAYGQPFSVKGLANRFKAWAREAGLPHCSVHGLRKAAATMAAESGATENELMAMFGWTKSEQAAHYTRAADRKRLAAAAAGRVSLDHIMNKEGPTSPAMPDGWDNLPEISNKIKGA
jgi:integrase